MGSIRPGPRTSDACRAAPTGEVAHTPIRERLLARLSSPATHERRSKQRIPGGASAKQGAVSRLIQVYANRGHLVANLDPLGLQERAKPYVLDLEYFGLSDADLDTEFFTGSRNQAIARTRQAQGYPRAT